MGFMSLVLFVQARGQFQKVLLLTLKGATSRCSHTRSYPQHDNVFGAWAPTAPFGLTRREDYFF